MFVNHCSVPWGQCGLALMFKIHVAANKPAIDPFSHHEHTSLSLDYLHAGWLSSFLDIPPFVSSVRLIRQSHLQLPPYLPFHSLWKSWIGYSSKRLFSRESPYCSNPWSNSAPSTMLTLFITQILKNVASPPKLWYLFITRENLPIIVTEISNSLIQNFIKIRLLPMSQNFICITLSLYRGRDLVTGLVVSSSSILFT